MTIVGSENQHCITITEETITHGHGMSICGQGLVCASQRANQHQERGLGQMKVGQQAVDHAEFIARVDEDPAIAGIGLNCAARSRRFQAAHRRGSHRDDPPTPAPGPLDGLAHPS